MNRSYKPIDDCRYHTNINQSNRGGEFDINGGNRTQVINVELIFGACVTWVGNGGVGFFCAGLHPKTWLANRSIVVALRGAAFVTDISNGGREMNDIIEALQVSQGVSAVE